MASWEFSTAYSGRIQGVTGKFIGQRPSNSLRQLIRFRSLLRPWKLNVWKLQFIDILKIVHDSVLIQLPQEGVYEDGA